MPRLRRLKQNYPFEDRQAAWPDDLRQKAAELPPAQVNDRATSPGPQPPFERMDLVERCFVAMTVAGFVGLIAIVIWMWLT